MCSNRVPINDRDVVVLRELDPDCCPECSGAVEIIEGEGNFESRRCTKCGIYFMAIFSCTQILVESRCDNCGAVFDFNSRFTPEDYPCPDCGSTCHRPRRRSQGDD